MIGELRRRRRHAPGIARGADCAPLAGEGDQEVSPHAAQRALAKFEDRIVPEIDKWFTEPPDWSYEDDYLPESGTAQGAAALAFFRDMAACDL